MARPSGGTTRGERTREHLLDVAEQLMSERGVDGVSLREIRLAANQRNTSALQFHFGDRKGLLAAITERHRHPQEAKLVALYDKMVAEGRQNDSRSLVEVLLQPVASYVFDGPSARAWIRLSAETASRPELQVHDFTEHSPPEGIKTGIALLDILETTMPRRVGYERLLMTTVAALHLCADRARIEGAAHPRRAHMDRDEFVENVTDMGHAAMFAPVMRSPRRLWPG